MASERSTATVENIREEIKALLVQSGSATNAEIRDRVLQRYPDTNRGTIQCTILNSSVNRQSRTNWGNNQRPRRCDGPFDLLFNIERGKVERYDPVKHGVWEIAEADDGTPLVRPVVEQSDSPEPPNPEETPATVTGRLVSEAQLRDYLVEHLADLEPGLEPYVDERSPDCIEVNTGVGRIDILAKDRTGALVVIELKVGRGPDAVCGQILRYMGWVKRHLADGQPVRGIIVAQRISDRIRYAMADVPGVVLKEYELALTIRNTEPLE